MTITPYLNQGVSPVDIYNAFLLEKRLLTKKKAFDIERTDDFIDFVHLFGVEGANQLYNEAQYYIIENKLEESGGIVPTPVKLEDLKKLVEENVTFEFLKEVRRKDGSLAHWGKMLKIDAVSDYIDSPEELFTAYRTLHGKNVLLEARNLTEHITKFFRFDSRESAMFYADKLKKEGYTYFETEDL